MARYPLPLRAFESRDEYETEQDRLDDEHEGECQDADDRCSEPDDD